MKLFRTKIFFKQLFSLKTRKLLDKKNTLLGVGMLVIFIIFVAAAISSKGITSGFSRRSGSEGTLHLPDFFNENGEFTILEIPPSDKSLDEDISMEIYSALGPTIFSSQNKEAIIPSILLHYRVKYVLFYDNIYIPLLKPFLEGKVDFGRYPQSTKVDWLEVVKREELPFLTLGKGWNNSEKEDGNIFYWIEQMATVNFYIPEGTVEKAPRILKFSAKHFPDESPLDIFFNDEYLGALYFSNYYSDMYIELQDLVEGENVIKLIAQDTCRAPSPTDKRCVSFAFRELSLVHESQVPAEGIIRYNSFFPEEKDSATDISSRWMSTKADIQIFTLNPQKTFITFEGVSYAKDRNLLIKIDKEEFQTYQLPTDSEFKRMGFTLELRRGNNSIEFLSDGCDVPALVEGDANDDEGCLGVQIRNFQQQALQ